MSAIQNEKKKSIIMMLVWIPYAKLHLYEDMTWRKAYGRSKTLACMSDGSLGAKDFL